MNRLALAALMVVAAFATQANAASVYFRGAVTTAIGGDPLGIMALPTQTFESLVNTNGAGGITSGYIVFQGKAFDFTTGAFGAVGPNNGFTGINLVDQLPAQNPSGVLTITIPGPVVPDTQAGMDSLIGRPGGTMFITFGGATYIGGIVAVPEPSSMLVLSGLVMGCGMFVRRRKIAA